MQIRATGTISSYRNREVASLNSALYMVRLYCNVGFSAVEPPMKDTQNRE